MERRKALLAIGVVGLRALGLWGREARAEETSAGATLENLTTAHQGASNAAVRYAECARRADADGYLKAGQLFRAVSASQMVNATVHAGVIRKLGGTPELAPDAVSVGTTRENLESALQAEAAEVKTVYPKYLEQARAEGKRDAVRSFNYAKSSVEAHVKLYAAALDELESYRETGSGWYVCQVCGFTAAKITFAKCPICFNPREKYNLIR